MFLKNYEKSWHKINLSLSEIEIIGNGIEVFCFNDLDFKQERDDLFIEGIIDTFNDLYWFIIGDGDCKDIFVDENINITSIKDTIFPDTKYDETIEKRSLSFIKVLKDNLNPSKIRLFSESLKDLYVIDEKYIKEKYYLKNDYQLGKLKTKQKILLLINDI